MEENNSTPIKILSGLFQDSDPSTQPEGTVRFALNNVNETDQGDSRARSNEESNEICAELPTGFIPIGKTYMNDGRIALFLVSENSDVSIIGIYDINYCTFVTHVNDSTSAPKDKLGFSLSHQIQAVYRLRLGCEDTIYWTDGNTLPKYYNFAKPEQFKKSDGTWATSKFSLQKTYESIPSFSTLIVEDSGGNIPPGSVNIAVQYLDESLNPTEFITSSPVMKIYNDISTKDFANIGGSTQLEQPLNFPNTDKSIRISLDNLDNNFLFYRLAFIMATTGTGLVSDVYYSSPIPTQIKDFVFTGDNYEMKGTLEEVKQVEDYIGSADTIAQIDNRILLGNLKGSSDDYCELQRAASKITVDCVLKEVVLNNITDPANPKNPSQESLGGTGYMPGEIYSLAIVWIFEDLSLSPAYHIPGKSSLDGNVVFSPGPNVFPMSANNSSETNTYIDISTCQGGNYWGMDYNNSTLLGKPVRHHRFPLRTEVGVPLVENTYGDIVYTDYYQLKIQISGEMFFPVPCPEATPDCGTDEYNVFNFRINYTVDGDAFSLIISVDPQYYADDINSSGVVDIFEESELHISNNIVITSIEVQDINGDYQDASTFDYLTAGYYSSGPTITDSISVSATSTQNKVVTSKMFGLKLSNIVKPVLSAPGSKEIIGYYIVRNHREEFDKTILDSAIMFPTFKNKKYIGSGLLQSQDFTSGPKRQKRVHSFINPEYKFNDRKYTSFDKLIRQGAFVAKETQRGLSWYNDVHPGSTYNEEIHKKKNNDDGSPADGQPLSEGKDGWSLALLTRDTIVDFQIKTGNDLVKSNIKNTFYLDALGNQPINDFKQEVFNIASDNKVGIIQTEEDYMSHGNDLGYYVMSRDSKNPYSDFMLRPYYKEMTNPSYFDTPNKTEVIYNGDSYISPMRYNNSLFVDNVVAKRVTKNKAWLIAVGAILTAVGVIAAIFTAGAGLAISVVGVSIAAAAAGILLVSSGIKGVNVAKAYGEAYAAGLKETAIDSYSRMHFIMTSLMGLSPFGFYGAGNDGVGKDGYTDDTIMWMNDCVTDLWFESSINFHLRNGFAGDELPTYLPSPWYSETGQNKSVKMTNMGKNGWHYIDGNSGRYPVSSLESHTMRKLLGFDDSRNDSRKYLGFALGEYYNVNKDYHRRNHEKVFFHLPLEYDCCSECQEEFPHRIRWSEQSFQEELSDSYRIFLPNNYKDIDGETGELTNIFSLNNNLFAHTEEALWLIPRSYQERITDQIVSFIGTGEFMSQPLRKIIDDDSGNSGGSRHKWGTVKTPSGVVFPSEHQNKIFLLQTSNRGEKEVLSPISDMGLTSYFKRHLGINLDKEYFRIHGEKYPYSNNPSNPIGSGFISVYDSRKNRVIITKKDLAYGIDDVGMICSHDGFTTHFPDFLDQVESQALLGFEFVRVTENCQLQFSKTVTERRESKRTIIIVEDLPSNLDIHFILNKEESFGDDCTKMLKQSVQDWVDLFGQYNPDWAGNYFQHTATTNRWLTYPDIVAAHYGGNTSDKEVLLVIVNNDGSTEYHSSAGTPNIPGPSVDYLNDYNNFVNNVYPSFASFNAMIIPFIQVSNDFTCSPSSADLDTTKNNFRQIAGSIWSGSPNIIELNNEFLGIQYLGWTPSEITQLISDLQGNNPFTMQGLRDFGWMGVWDGAITQIGPNYTPERIDELLANYFSRHFVITSEEVNPYWEEGEVTYYNFLDGERFIRKGLIDNSWTMSFDLSQESPGWISWHSYLPSFYISSPEEFSSWIYQNDNLWRHNKLGEYQKFFGTRKPFIVEVVSASNPVATRIWDYIRLSTNSMKYDFDSHQFNDERFVTFNKALFYNSRQTSGILNLIVKDTNPDDEDYLLQQVQNLSGDSIIIDRNEKDWTLNDLRDNRIDYTKAMFSENVNDLQDDFFIDKVLNTGIVDYNKDWQDLESFRDKYLVIRLIFDNFDDVKLILNHTVTTETNSYR